MIKSITLWSAALVYTFFGLAFLVVPQLLPGLMEFSMSAGSEMVARSYGGLLVGIGIANWMAINRPTGENRALYLGNLIWHPISTYVILQATVTGTVNGLGYPLAGFHFLWLIGFAILFFKGASVASGPMAGQKPVHP